MALDTGQDCPPSGCWWERVDITRKVLSFLPTNKDVLICDLVCRKWADLKVGHASMSCTDLAGSMQPSLVQISVVHATAAVLPSQCTPLTWIAPCGLKHSSNSHAS